MKIIIKQITDTLLAMGAKPIATDTENGTIIKVNAPIINDRIKNNENTENKKT